MGTFRRWNGAALGACAVCLVFLVVFVGLVHTAHSEMPGEPVEWNVLPNGLIVVEYDRTGDGMPDYFTLHQITWSGWTGMSLDDITTQAQADGHWVFVAQEDHIRYVYLTNAVPLFFADNPQQDGRWTAVPVESREKSTAVNVWICHVCKPEMR